MRKPEKPVYDFSGQEEVETHSFRVETHSFSPLRKGAMETHSFSPLRRGAMETHIFSPLLKDVQRCLLMSSPLNLWVLKSQALLIEAMTIPRLRS